MREARILSLPSRLAKASTAEMSTGGSSREMVDAACAGNVQGLDGSVVGSRGCLTRWLSRSGTNGSGAIAQSDKVGTGEADTAVLVGWRLF